MGRVIVERHHLTKRAEQRLRVLCEFMEKLPKKAESHFRMDSFVNLTPAQIPLKGVTLETLMECGTTACAGGFAAVVPQFRRAGLVYDRFGFRYKVKRPGPHRGKRGPEQLREFFDLTHAQFGFLFFSSSKRIRTPHQWAQRCRATYEIAK